MIEHLIRCSTLSDWSMHLIRCDVQRSPNCIVIEIAHACSFGTPEDENKTPQPINYILEQHSKREKIEQHNTTSISHLFFLPPSLDTKGGSAKLSRPHIEK